jgi:hypothetical protein
MTPATLGRKVNDDRSLRQRACYYTRIYGGPKNIGELHLVNVTPHGSSDWGGTFATTLRTRTGTTTTCGPTRTTPPG